MGVDAAASNFSASPRGLLQPEVLAGLSTLELVARSVVEGFLVGLHRSPRFGFSQEFAEYRAYAEGDDPRFIDWNVYARTDRTVVKRFLGETNARLTVMLDASASMGFGGPPVSKLDYGKFLAASLAYLSQRQHDAVGCLVFDEEVRDVRRPSSRTGQLASVLHCLDAAQARAATDLDTAVHAFAAAGKKRGLVVVISDFYCDVDALLNSVRELAWQGQDLILFQLLDKEELAPASDANVLFEDMETGEAVEVSPRFLAERYPERMRDHISAIARAASGLGADHVMVETDKPLDRALRDYLVFRERRR